MSFGNTCDIPSQECHVVVDDIINSNFFRAFGKTFSLPQNYIVFKDISEFRFYFNVEQISLKIEGMPLFFIDFH